MSEMLPGDFRKGYACGDTRMWYSPDSGKTWHLDKGTTGNLPTSNGPPSFCSRKYALRRPTGQQTSFEQPVRLRKVKQRFTGEVTGYTLAFTQPDYAREFTAANQPAVEAGAVEVKAA